MADEVKQITIEDILSDYHREILSPPAVKLYAAVWYRMGNRGVTEISMSNEEVYVKARVPMSGISKVQSELARMGLLEVFPNGNETKYKFISDPDNPDQTIQPGQEHLRTENPTLRPLRHAFRLATSGARGVAMAETEALNIHSAVHKIAKLAFN